MAIYSYAPSLGNQKPKGIANVYVKLTADTGYSTLGDLRNGKAHIRSLQSQTTYKRSTPFSAIAEYEFEMLQCSKAEIELLDTLIAGNTLVVVKTVDAQYYVHNVTATLLGMKYKIVADAKLDTNRFILIQMKVGLLDSELDTVMPAVAPTLDAPASGDTFWSIANTGILTNNAGRKENIVPAGVSTFGLCAIAESTYRDMGEVTNSSLTFESFGNDSDKLRYRNIGVTVLGNFDTLQDSNTEKSNLDLIHTNGANIQVTFFDAVVFTLADKVGIQWNEGFDGDFDGHKLINYKFDGNVLVSAIDDIVA